MQCQSYTWKFYHLALFLYHNQISQYNVHTLNDIWESVHNFQDKSITHKSMSLHQKYLAARGWKVNGYQSQNMGTQTCCCLQSFNELLHKYIK